MGKFVWAIGTFSCLSVIYLVLAGSVDAVEITVMAICAALGTALAFATETVAKRHFSPRPPLGAVIRPFAALVPELLSVGRELSTVALSGSTAQRGAFVQQPFEPGEDDPRSSARRALTIIGISLAPRTFAIRGERTGDILLHGLPPKPVSRHREWPA